MATAEGTALAPLLERLGVGARHLPSLVAEGVTGADDLRRLTPGDCRALGMSIGERNRLLEWAAGGVAGLAVVETEEKAELERLEQLVAERAEYMAGGRELLADDAARRATDLAARASGRGPGRARVRTQTARQTRVKAATATAKRRRKKTRAKALPNVKAVVNALFANAGTAIRIGFALDISGSMGADTPMGCDRMEVVKQHLAAVLRSMEGVRNAAFGLALFDQACQLPVGKRLLPASWVGLKTGLEAVSQLRPGGGNGGEADCLDALVAMRPQAIFFLGDGGWDANQLIASAKHAATAGIVVHSIAFFTSGGGLPEIASLTGGSYREINGASDLQAAAAPQPTATSAEVRPGGSVGGGGEGIEGGEGSEESDEDGSSEDGTGSSDSEEQSGGSGSSGSDGE
jgi:uncharacterized membrane protein YgcG